MKRRRRNWLPFAVPMVVVGIVALGWVLEGMPTAVDAAAPMPAPGTATGPEADGFDRLFKAGVESLRLGRPAAAAGAFERAGRLRPRVPEVHVNLGYAYLGLGRYAAAETAFRTAIQLRPAQANAYYGLAESLEARHDLGRALGAMKTYLHLTEGQGPFRRRAMAAIWEWQTALDDGGRRESPEQPSGPTAAGAAP
jgi:tetratricopeptide (TPR) repeat protein